MGVWRSGSQQRDGGDARIRARDRGVAEVGMEAETDAGIRELGCRRGRIDWIDGVGRGACGRTQAGDRLLQHGRRGIGHKVRGFGGAQPETVPARGHEGRAQPGGWDGL